MFCACILCCSVLYWLHSAYSGPYARETHAGWQCADRRKVNNRDHTLYTHFTRTLHAKYIDKIHNSTLGGEINTIPTGQIILTPCIHLRGPFRDPGSCVPAAPGPWVSKWPRWIQCVGFSTPSVLCIQFNQNI